MSQQTITINGKLYDAHTGMPVHMAKSTYEAPNDQSRVSGATPNHAQSVHRAVQKSQTLNRRTVQKIAVQSTATPIHSRAVVQKSPAITKFAPHPRRAEPTVAHIPDIAPVDHPIVAKAQQQRQQAVRQHAAAVHHAPKPSQMIKQEAIAEALHTAPRHSTQNKQIKHAKKHPRMVGIASASFALLLLGGYFTYLNMPNLSVRVAAAQAGVDASYPEYRPDGYSLRGPVAYSQGAVTMKFAANAGPQNFTIAQTKSSWDSSAVLDNYVKGKAGDNYVAYNERGLTIYTFGGDAAWVNGGILYTISGDAPLSSDQIRRIATSL
jgi:hypothetical protein